MEQHRHEALARIDHWQDVLTRTLARTPLQHEKHRLERELAELQQTRLDTEGMTADQLRQLSERLAADPWDWVEHHAG